MPPLKTGDTQALRGKNVAERNKYSIHFVAKYSDILHIPHENRHSGHCMDNNASELLIVSGYASLIDSIRDVCSEFDISPATIEWERANPQLVQALTNMFRETSRPDVIISRGAVADIIETSFTDIVVLRAEPDDIDLMEVLAKAATMGPKVGFLIYEPYAVAFKTESVRRILGLETLKPYPFRSKRDIERIVAQGRDDGMNVMVGGGRLGLRTGNALGYPVLFVETGKRSIRSAITQALAIIEARRGEKRQLSSLRTIVSSVQEGIMTLRGKEITMVNEPLVNMLCLPHEKVAFPDNITLALDDLNAVLRRFLTREKPSEEIIRIQDKMFFCKKVPLQEGTNRDETMLICRDITVIQQQERKIRRELHAKGFTARFNFNDIIGRSRALKPLLNKARTFAETDANILIYGESGTGKELFAQSIHNASARRNRPFVAVNCAAIPETLLESELFGYEEGAFSGARRSGKPGLFELAHEGTIFLDEIDSLPIGLQGVLLRVIQEKQVRKVGSANIMSVDARIISATNSDIEKLIDENAFRSDLYYRLNTLSLDLPPLADRREDIFVLARHFLEKYAAKYHISSPRFTDSDKALLLTHAWNGNVRELENVVHRYVLLNKNGSSPLSLCLDVPPPKQERTARMTREDMTITRGTLEEIEREVILRYLEENHWNKQKAADKLGICRATLWRKLKSAA
ncbi:MAG: sigma 54-interacting transcriptional regulator [Candidatus Accumulibacter sp.]|nr:sigma 54-interacting transcriptional regulator [Accumulibacter sp.]